MSRLERVTIAGADERTDPKELLRLSERYPFVEWAFLFSVKRSGKCPRYPGMEYLLDVQKLCTETGKLQTALHLCGSVAEKMNGLDPHKTAFALALYPCVGRIQFNVAGCDEMVHERTAEGMIGVCQALMTSDLILQTRTFNTIACYMLVSAEKVLRNQQHGALSLLLDASGGTGQSPVEWEAPLPGISCAYAGGIGPDNILSNLLKIDRVVRETPGALDWGIDMESGVRDENDVLDLAKVEHVLDVADRFRKSQERLAAEDERIGAALLRDRIDTQYFGSSNAVTPGGIEE